MKTRMGIPGFAVLGLLLFSEACAPVFSEMQGARTVGVNRLEIMPSGSLVSVTDDNETEGVQNHVGFQAAYGLTSRLDLRLRYEYLWLEEDSDTHFSVLGIGPKYSFLENKIAFYLPVGRAFGEDSKDSWELQPTLLFSIPAIKNRLDINLSPKYLFILCEDCDDLVAFNFGLSISNNLSRWSVRPEYGLLYNPGESGHFSHFSLGLAFAFGK